jgi:hypothetical protein
MDIDYLDLFCCAVVLVGFVFGLLGWLSLRRQCRTLPAPQEHP